MNLEMEEGFFFQRLKLFRESKLKKIFGLPLLYSLKYFVSGCSKIFMLELQCLICSESFILSGIDQSEPRILEC